jgi:alginate O-acetyltransferase complex protein AlgI
MVFNSFTFFVFFFFVYSLYLVLNHRRQNKMLLAASYFFYGWWDWRFLSLIFISTVTDYLCGLQIDKHREVKVRKIYLTLSVLVNLTILGFFKYFNFFADSFVSVLSFFGIHHTMPTLNVILPVGISFYTFQTMSYTIDIYRKQIKPTRNFLDYALYVSFFPQLVAGPIERATNLLPQILTKRKIGLDQVLEGCWLIYFGLFKKIFVADNLGLIVDSIFGNPLSLNGGMVLLALYAFSFQIYCDFSAYSDIARGIAKLMGIEIMINFKFPYFSKSIQEFWRRWHISLSTWLRDYIYIPLGGSQCPKSRHIINIMAVFLICGLWHGAQWTFVIWGAIHGAYLASTVLLQPIAKRIKIRDYPFSDNLSKFLKVFLTFHAVTFAWVFFRSQSVKEAGIMINSLLFDLTLSTEFYALLLKCFFYCLPVILIDFFQYKKGDFFILFKLPAYLRYTSYSLLFYLLAIFGTATESFIYFQF